MSDYRLVQVDAFADRPFTGNPAAVIPLKNWLDDATMQAIAAENNLAETAFLVPSLAGLADYELRWFTPEVEIAMCGHATLASGHVLLSDDPARDRIRFSTRKAGVLEVRRAAEWYELDLPMLTPSPTTDSRSADALGIGAEHIFHHDAGYYLTLMTSEAELRALKPDFRKLAAAVPDSSVHIVTAAGQDTDFVSRVFVPGAGIDEDPVTGSAHAMLTPYWAERLGKIDLTAFQASRRGGYLSCRVAGDRVVLTGHCVTVIEGVMRLA